MSEQIDEGVNLIRGHFVVHGFSFFGRKKCPVFLFLLEDEKKGLRLPRIPQEEEEEEEEEDWEGWKTFFFADGSRQEVARK